MTYFRDKKKLKIMKKIITLICTPDKKIKSPENINWKKKRRGKLNPTIIIRV